MSERLHARTGAYQREGVAEMLKVVGGANGCVGFYGFIIQVTSWPCPHCIRTLMVS